ncbi:hypothetical protein [Cohnella terricola]|uniref:Uncharacterized protein n=1 Tax=Cohnella terricola TaxID=1289167 RepID=A0A559JDL4_9BACL|nr:hypothetical protein [Cohnella terricola]TVX97959.1 hypothetical protein FPZ45_17080 [Cohnella terricola]
MYMYDLEKLAKRKGFVNTIINTCEKMGLDEALELVKKSGICIDFFGSGKPSNSEKYQRVMDSLLSLHPNEEKIIRFENEVATINQLYKDFTNNQLREIEQLIDDDIHISSFLIAIELFLANDIHKLQYGSALNNNRSDVFENVAESSGQVLQYLIKHKNFPLENPTLKIDFENVKNAAMHIRCSDYRAVLDVLRELWSYFELDIHIDEFITATSKGDRTLGKTISHMKFLDVRNAKQTRYAHQQLILYGKYSTISKTRKLAPHDFISYNERMTCEFVEEYFSTNNLDIKFLDITIAEYIRAYCIIVNECETFIKKRKLKSKYSSISLQDVCIVKTKRKWIYLFIEWGLKQTSAEKIFDLLVFGDKSADLLDCPLLKVGDEYIVIPSISGVTDPSRALLSNLKSKEVDVKIKGTLFEDQIRTLLTSVGLKNIHLDKPDYECDVVFALDNDLFFTQVKHLNDPTSYRDYMRNLDEIHSGAMQLDRVVDYYSQEEYLLEIRRKLGIAQINNIYKMVVTNTAQGENLNIDDIFVIDDIGFSGFFLRRPPQRHELQKNIIVSRTLFEKHYVGEISSGQFIDFIKNNPFIEHYKKRIEHRTFDYTEQIGLKLMDFGVNINTVVNVDKLSPKEQYELNQAFESSEVETE